MAQEFEAGSGRNIGFVPDAFGRYFLGMEIECYCVIKICEELRYKAPLEEDAVNAIHAAYDFGNVINLRANEDI